MLMGQILIGLVNGAFYAMLSLGVAVIFGMLRIANFAHGAQYMLGALVAWLLLNVRDLFPDFPIPPLGYWWAIVLVPLILAAVGGLTERIFIRRIYSLDHAYGFLLTIGLSMIMEGLAQVQFTSAGVPYSIPGELQGALNLGFMYLPKYRAWVILVSLAICFGTWLVIERTQLGSYLRAATENSTLVRAFGINVPRLLTLTYAGGVGLAGLAGVMAAPIYQVSPLMGQNLIVTVFAVVVIGGMGSIIGAVISGFLLGLLEGLTHAIYAPAASVVVFVLMAVVLLLTERGLFGKNLETNSNTVAIGHRSGTARDKLNELQILLILLLIGLIAPFILYPVFMMKVLCFALFACAYNLLFGYTGLLAFGHAAFFGSGAYITAQAVKAYGAPPELAIAIGTLVATAIGAVFGWLAIRRRGLYFAMITLALAQIIYFYAVQSSWTQGEDGITMGPRGKLFGFIDLSNEMSMYFFTLAIFLVSFAIIHRAIRSPFGHALIAVRENESRAIALGYNVKRIKLFAFIFSAAFSGLAGSIKAMVFQLASLSDVFFSTSADVLLMVLIGGAGTILGPLYGAFIFVTMLNYLAGWGAWVITIQGIIFVTCVLFMRKGVAGAIQDLIHRAHTRMNPSNASNRVQNLASVNNERTS